MSYWFGSTSSYGYGYNAQIGVMSPQPEYVPGQSGMNYYPTSTIGVAPYAPVSSTPPASGSKPMGYSYGYDGYVAHPYYYSPPSSQYSSGAVPNYVEVTGSQFNYSPDQNPVAPPVEQVNVTGTNPYGPYTGGYVQVTPNQLPNPYGQFTGDYVQVTPQNPDTLPQYQQSSRSGGSPGGGAAGSGGGNPSPPQKQQPQQQQRPVQVIVNTGAPNHRSGAGYGGGNTGALYNPSKQNGSYYGGSQYGQASAGYNAPSIVPYLLLGGLGIAAFGLLKHKGH